MKSFLNLLLISLALLAVARPASAATINVPSLATPTIQSGIAAAKDLDTVLVAPGIYFEHIDFMGKDIHLTSTLSTDPATIQAATMATIIDGGSTGPVVSVSAEIDQISTPVGYFRPTLSFFTIQNGGLPVPGSALTMYGGINISKPGFFTVIGNMIAHNNYGGIVIYGGDATVASNTISQNGCWGIISYDFGDLSAFDNEVSATQTPAMGCMYTDYFGVRKTTNSSAILIDEGVVFDDEDEVTIRGNTIEDNVQVAAPGAPIEGGAGIAVYSGTVTIDDNILRRNSSPSGRGGAIDIVGGTGIDISQNAIYQNQAGCGGGAISFNFAGLQTNPEYALFAANNTIVDNTSANSTAAGCSGDQQIDAAPDGLAGPSVAFVNNVISGGATAGPAMNCHQQAVPSIYNQALFDHNLLFNGGQPFFGSSCVDESAGQLNSLFGNIVAVPKFVNPLGLDYALASSSPGVDFGNNGVLRTLQVQESFYVDAFDYEFYFSSPPANLLLSFLPLDFLLNLRFQDASGKVDGTGKEIDVIDMGAYESSGTSDQLHTVTMALPATGYPATMGPSTLTAYINGGYVSNPPYQLIVPPGTITFFVDGVQTGDPAPVVSTTDPFFTAVRTPIGVAYAPVNFTPGAHVLTATYQPAPGVTSTQSIAVVVNIPDTPAELTLTANPYSSRLGEPVIFTVTAQPEFGGYIPSPISLVDLRTNTLLGTVIPDTKTGVGTFTTTTLPLGYSAFEADFEGQGEYPSGNSNQISVDVTTPTALTLQSAENPAQAFTPFNLTAQFDPPSSAPASGYVAFSAINTAPGSYGQAIGRGNIADGSATKAVTLPAGTYNITAAYPGDATFSASTSSAIVETVLGLPTTLTLTSSVNPAVAFESIPLTAHLAVDAPVPTGSLTGGISFMANGRPIGTAAIDSTGNATIDATLAAGIYTLTASFAGNANLAASKSSAIKEIINKDSTLASLSLTPNPGYTPGENETLIAAIAAASSKTVPTGTVIFYDNFNNATTALPGVAVGIAGQALFTASTLLPGSHIITGSYSGDANFLPSTSAPVHLNIILSDFTLAADPTITIQTEYHKNLNATLTSLGDLAGTVNLSCSNLPEFASCNFVGNAPRLSAGATVDTAIDIGTDVILNFRGSIRRELDPQVRKAIVLAILFPFALITAHRKLKGRLAGLFSIIVLFALGTLTGCSGHYPDHTPPGTYTFTLSGTAAATGITHSTTITLIITK